MALAGPEVFLGAQDLRASRHKRLGSWRVSGPTPEIPCPQECFLKVIRGVRVREVQIPVVWRFCVWKLEFPH